MSAKPGVFVQGVGYKVPPRSKTHDPNTGARLKRASLETLNAMKTLKTSRIPEERSKARQTIYHDPAIMCSKEELEQFSLLGAAICYEHDTSKKIGTILNYNVINETGDMSLTASITDPEWQSRISSGDFDAQFFSINYDFRLDRDGNVIDKRFKELSLVKKPYYNGCDMGYYAGLRQGLAASSNMSEDTSDKIDDIHDECFVVFLNDEMPNVSTDDGFFMSIRCSHEAGLQVVSGGSNNTSTAIDMEVEQKTNEAMATTTTAASTNSGQLGNNTEVATTNDFQQNNTTEQQENEKEDVDVDMDADQDVEEGPDDVSTLKRQLAELKSVNRKFAEANRKSTQDLTKSMFEAIAFNPAQPREGAVFNTEDAQKLAQAMQKMSDDDPSTMKAFESYMKAISSQKKDTNTVIQKNVSFPEKLATIATTTTTTPPSTTATPLKNNGVGTNTSLNTKNNANMRMASADKTSPEGVKKPGFNLQQKQTGFFNTGTKRRADTNSDVLDSIFPNYKKQRTDGAKSAFHERFDQQTTTTAIKASSVEDRARGERRHNPDNYTILSPGANFVFVKDLERQLREFNETGTSKNSPFFRTSRRGLFDSTGETGFNVAASKDETNAYEIPDSRSGRLILPKVYDANYSKPYIANQELYNISASLLDKTFPSEENSNYGRFGSSVIQPVVIGGIVDWNSSMIVGHQDDEGLTGAHSVMASAFDVAKNVGRCAVLASDHFPCEMELLENNTHLKQMASMWSESPMFQGISPKDAMVMNVLYSSPLMGYAQVTV